MMLHSILEGLHSRDEESRLIAATETGELVATGQLSLEEHRLALEKLIEAVLHEPDSAVQESILNSILIAGSSRRGGLDNVPWERLCLVLPTLEGVRLEYALMAIGFSSRAEFASRIEPYLTHPEDIVREAAIEALVELRQPHAA